jgi:hypothetical protein
MENTEIISLPISPKLVIAVAHSYKDPYRPLIEFVDNSIDQADKLFYDTESNSYTKEINIIITLTGKSYRDAKITIEDNCGGIDWLLQQTVYSIGYSPKTNETISNGKFGFGMMSFLYFCKRLKVTTKDKENPNATVPEFVNSVIFDGKNFDKPGSNDVPIELSSYEYKGNTEDAFTIIELSEFNREKYSQIDLKKLQSEIELHFDMILRRKNLNIKIIDNRG